MEPTQGYSARHQVQEVPYHSLNEWIARNRHWRLVFHYTDAAAQSFLTSRGVWSGTWAIKDPIFTSRKSAKTVLGLRRLPDKIILISNRDNVFSCGSSDGSLLSKHALPPLDVKGVCYLRDPQLEKDGG